MSDEMRFDGRVAIVTGAGGGLGRTYALLLASRGAKVVVNDLGGSAFGQGADATPADEVVAEIVAAGGTAVPNYDSVENGDKIVQTALDTFGSVDIVVNNAGILRDTSFHKMSEQDWELIYRVHLYGSFKVTHAAWPYLRDQQYGRVIFTTSAAGIYGNFGQANYGTAKLGLLGLANTLAIEGQKRNVHVNTIAPMAGSRLTETVLPQEMVEALKPEYVAPLVAYLCHESCDVTGQLFEVGAGWVSRLRWQRSQGAFFPVHQPITPEQVGEKWAVIDDFAEAENPTTIMDSFVPITRNLQEAQAAAASPRNEFVDVAKAMSYQFTPEVYSYTERDVSLYALSVGAAKDPLDAQELQFVYELNGAGFHALPTFGVTFPFVVLGQIMSVPGLKFNPMMLLHGEQYMELKRPLPTSGTFTQKAKISQIYDKGKGALIITDISSVDEHGEEVVFNQSSVFIRGIGGFGGERGPSGDINQPPDRAPDAVHEDKTDENQALLYRLSSGDRNPLHADPAMAAMGGFERPILHGLCFFGFAGRAVLKHFADNDPARFKSIKVRFAKHVFPGETIVTEMWRESETRIVFRSKVKERDEVVLSNAAVELYPKSEERGAKGEERGAAVPRSQAIFEEMGWRMAQNPQWVQEVGAVYQFNLRGDEGGMYVVDLKEGNGRCYPGTAPNPDCTLTIAYPDFLALTTGELDPQAAFMSGKLKINGNIVLSTKLQRLFS
ncbi:MAG: SDR family NAD(P)-dependent oxidoreductase [Ardenticatenaceae bacterium]|nr:SDR family NAD(P)-dependent oxidoreductase [Ardenticatenaceae bacterium]